MSQRLDTLLKQLLQIHAPSPLNDDSVRGMATHLARHGVLVLVADVPARLSAQRESTVNAWIGHYGELYQLLVSGLFPSLTQIRAVYADDALPPVIAIIAQSDMITRHLAGYIVPYVASRSQQDYAPLEVRGVVSAMLEALGGATLTHGRFAGLRDECASQVRHLLALPLEHTCLTDFAPPLLANWQFGKAPDPTPPPDLPETENYAPPAPRDLFSNPVPIFFRRDNDGDKKRRPPVPPPPKRP